MLDETLIELTAKNANRRKWLLIPVSLLAHVLAIAALVVVPLLLAESDLPQVQMTNVRIIAPPRPTPPPPPPPPYGRGKGSGGSKTSSTDAKKTADSRVYTGKLIAPIEVPETIEEESADFGVEGGVPWGVPGGVIGGVEGGVVGGVLGGVLGGSLPEEQPVFVSGSHVPKLIRQVKPEYPQEAFSSRTQAIVIVEATTDIYGRVNSARIIIGDPVFNQAALAAVRQWLYEPYIISGVPRPICFTVKLNFGFVSQ